MNRTLIVCVGVLAAVLGAEPRASAQAAPATLPAATPAAAQSSPLTVALTFDDLPAHGDLPPRATRFAVAESILFTLRHEKMPPVYGFVNGKHVEKDPDTIGVLQLWHSAGEPLGSHTFEHKDLDAITVQEFEADIAKNEPLLRDVAGDQDWHMFRYPYLHEGSDVAKRREIQRYLKENGYRIAEVSLDFGDYQWNTPYARCAAKKDMAAIGELEKSYLAAADQSITALRAASQHLYGRDIPYVLLLHIGAFDARMLPQLIPLLRQRGFSFATLEDALKDPAYAIDPAIGYNDGGMLHDLAAVLPPANTNPAKQLDAVCR